ncbi:MAG: hypothetical protein PHX27_04795 [Candidatus ainarchaeum sp.]|nr:hypothetical protein [Candidatus ainarchaeum sp.]
MQQSNFEIQKNKAQGTIEYLVIIAIVVVISLVVVGLLISQTSSVSATDQKTTNLVWKTKEVQIMDFAVDLEGNGTMILNSNLIDGITLDSIVVGSSTNPSTKQMFLGSVQKFSLTNLTACTAQNQKYIITINYTTKEGLDKSVNGEFYANCISNALTLNSLNLSDTDATSVTNMSAATGYLVMVNSSAVATDAIDDLTQGTNADNQLRITENEIKLGTN